VIVLPVSSIFSVALVVFPRLGSRDWIAGL
jgi:hypothetical protein